MLASHLKEMTLFLVNKGDEFLTKQYETPQRNLRNASNTIKMIYAACFALKNYGSLVWSEDS